MYRLIFTLYIFTMLATGSAQWEILNQSGLLSSMDFVNSETGWIAGSGSLMKTDDGGINWLSVASSESLNIFLSMNLRAGA